MGAPAAERLFTLATSILGARPPVRLRAWDGSQAGDKGAPTLVVRDKRALRRLVWQRGELGFANAYILGEIDIEGDLIAALSRTWQWLDEQNKPRRKSWQVLRTALALKVLGPAPAPPQMSAQPTGALHSKKRDQQVIAHHYDFSNEFYELILDSSMAYSCAYWTCDDPTYGLAQAQFDKLDLICRKLGLRPGMRMLDVGCGWSGLAIHAAKNFGVQVTGITLSEAQRGFGEKRVAEAGLADRITVRLQDYRDLDDEPYDAVASIEMGEHVGAAQYPTYLSALHRSLRPRGRLLLQQMSRHDDAPGGGPFIETYIAPDMHMRPVGETVSLVEAAGLEVRDVHALREHYVHTARAWLKNLDTHEAAACDMVGDANVRLWRLYLAGGALAFAQNRMGVDQILAVRPTKTGETGMPEARRCA
ncbi:MAG: class I SAM-dependent methyltransferase [Corynebacteriales bacterium]|nr:class I SAM-dependent methyltransferase [Mycobacteriales bacterium]